MWFYNGIFRLNLYSIHIKLWTRVEITFGFSLTYFIKPSSTEKHTDIKLDDIWYYLSHIYK